MDSALKTHMSAPLSLLVLGAVTPPEVDVEIADENVERVRFDDRPDLVGITVKVDTLARSRAIARIYRARGVPVVVGGIYPTTCPHESLAIADAVAVGEGESLWPRILRDAAAGRLQRVYRSEEPLDMADSPVPRWELAVGKNYLFANTITSSRGCPWKCEFCYSSASGFHRGYRPKPIENVLAEIRSLGTRHVMFIDDNFMGSPERTRRLLRAIGPMKLTWHAAVSADVGRHPELMDLMAESGCRSLFIGFETLNRDNLADCGKSQNRVEDYARTIEALHAREIMVNASIVFGFDGDGPGVFESTVDWLTGLKIETMTAHILTPYPGTPMYRRMLAEGRIIDSDLSRYNTAYAVFRPKGMTPAELEAGYRRAYRRFYSWASVLERMPAAGARRRAYLIFNLFYRRLGPATGMLGRLGLMGLLARLGRNIAYHGLPLPPRARDEGSVTCWR
ncbi:MAG: B12-binding domain-containing radical SAM protein [Planctomycetota bacterium]|jgi:radical SAM superfamily enzyme YgiQ (UPF0313 family)